MKTPHFAWERSAIEAYPRTRSAKTAAKSIGSRNGLPMQIFSPADAFQVAGLLGTRLYGWQISAVAPGPLSTEDERTAHNL